jgi:hypothetical protein
MTVGGDVASSRSVTVFWSQSEEVEGRKGMIKTIYSSQQDTRVGEDIDGRPHVKGMWSKERKEQGIEAKGLKTHDG